MPWFKSSLFVCIVLLFIGAALQYPTPVTAQTETPTPTPLVSLIDPDGFGSRSAEAGIAPTLAAGRQFTPTESDTLTLIFFEADWCPYCKQLAPVINDLADEYTETLTVEWVDIDDRANRPIVREYDVRAIPHLVLLDKRGYQVEEYIGVTPKRTLEREIRALLLQLSPFLEPQSDAADFLQ